MSTTDLRSLKWGPVAPIPEEINETPQLSTGVSTILRNNPNRVQAYLYNPSSIQVHLRWGADPTTSVGYPLEANGGQKAFSFEEDGERVFGDLRAIAASGTPTIFVAADRMPKTQPRKVA